MTDTARKLIAQILANQKKKFSRHQLSVAFTALSLARTHNVDPEQVFMAAMMHDMVKKSPSDLVRTFLSEAPRNAVEPLDEFELRNDGLLHGAAAAELMAVEYGIADEAVLAAVRYHSTGHPQMGPVGQILMTADYCEPLRPWKDEAERILAIAKRDLAAGFTEVLRVRHERHRALGIEEHPRTIAALKTLDLIFIS